MKKIFLLLMIFVTCLVFSEEATLLDTSVFGEVSVSEYPFSNWEVVTQSSLKTDSEVKMTPKGLGVKVDLPIERSGYVSYKIVPPYSTSLNEVNKSLGYLENVGEIKQIQIIVEGINKADEITVYLSRSYLDKVGTPYKFKGDTSFIGEGILIWENANYISDPAKRTKVAGPVYGNETSNLFLRAIEIRTECNWPISLVYIKEIKIIYDLDKTPDELERIKENEEVWGVNNSLNEEIKQRELKKLEIKKENTDYNSALMHNEEPGGSSAK